MSHAVQLLWQQQMVGLLEEQHREGYLRHPVGADEFQKFVHVLLENVAH